MASRRAVFCVLSLSLNKESTKETRASNSVLMGKLNYPLPKNFACKILPIENKIFSGPNALKKPARLFSFTIFWWLPKGVVASAIFAQRNPKISLLLQAGDHFLLYSMPRFKANRGEKHIRFSASLAVLPPRAAGGESEIVFVEKSVEPGCVADSKKFCFFACVRLSCLQVSLTCKRKS